jgi:primosomal protein N'
MIRLEVAVAAPLKQTLSYLSADIPFPDETLIGKRVLVPLGGLSLIHI